MSLYIDVCIYIYIGAGIVKACSCYLFRFGQGFVASIVPPTHQLPPPR